MNNTRKAIADLIWVKTRKSEYWKLNWDEVRILNDDQYVDTKWIVRDRKLIDIIPIYEFCNDFEYDITAVLKYIYSNWDWTTDVWYSYIWLYTTQMMSLNTEKKELKIPNKPLHLYTEQEEKDLLELLNKLWK